MAKQNIPLRPLQDQVDAITPIVCYVTDGDGQTITEYTDTTVDFTQVSVDTAGSWDTTNNQYECPVDGLYQISCAVNFSAAISGDIQLRITKDGAAIGQVVRLDVGANMSTMLPAVIADCSSGDILKTQVYFREGSDTGDTKTLSTSAARCYMSIVKIN